VSAAELTRDVATAASVLGVLLLLVPLRAIRPAYRLAGLVLVVGAWAALAVTLLPDGETDRLTRPAGAAAAVVGILVAAGLLAAGTWVALRWPLVWFVALGLALPVRIPIPVGGDQRNLLLPLYALIAVGVAGHLWMRLRRRAGPEDDPRTPVDWALAAFLGFAVLSALWSVDTKEATVKLVFFYLPYLLLYLAVVAWWRRTGALQALTATTVGLSSAVALLAVEQYLTRDIFWNVRLQQANVYSRFFRANGIFYDPNILGRYLVLGIIAIVAVAWLRPRARELAAGAALLLVLCAGLFTTFSRSSCLMLMVALGIMSWHAFGGRRTLAVGGATLLILAAGAFVVSDNVRGAATDMDRLEKVSEGRFDLIRGGVKIWREAPLHGAGLGGFEAQYQERLTPSEQRRVRVVISHNTPVTVLSELGLVGLALFGLLGVEVWRRIAGAARRDGPASWQAWARWTMLGAIVGIFVHALFYAGYFEDPFLWVLAAGALALAPPAPRVPEAAPVPEGEGEAAPV
jgi:O-antigen ligase